MKRLWKTALTLTLCLALCAVLFPGEVWAVEGQDIYVTDFAEKTFGEVKELLQEYLPDWDYNGEFGEGGFRMYCSCPAGGMMIFWCNSYPIEVYQQYWEFGEDASVLDGENVDAIFLSNLPMSIDPILRMDMSLSELVAVCEAQKYEYDVFENNLSIQDYQGTVMSFFYETIDGETLANGAVYRKLPESNSSPDSIFLVNLIGKTVSEAKSYMEDYYSGWDYRWGGEYYNSYADDIWQYDKTCYSMLYRGPMMFDYLFIIADCSQSQYDWFISNNMDSSIFDDLPVTCIHMGTPYGNKAEMIPGLCAGTSFSESITICEQKQYQYSYTSFNLNKESGTRLNIFDELGQVGWFQWMGDKYYSSTFFRNLSAIQGIQTIQPSSIYEIQISNSIDFSETREKEVSINVFCPNVFSAISVYLAKYCLDGKMQGLDSIVLTSNEQVDLSMVYDDNSFIKIIAVNSENNNPICIDFVIDATFSKGQYL